MGVKRRQLLLFGGTVFSVGFLQQVVFGQDTRRIGATLKSITLRVVVPGPSGSGVIVRKSGNTYTFLTAKHVLENASPGEEVYVVTADGNEHRVNLSTSQTAPSSDLALASFSSSNNYSVAILGNSEQMQELDSVYVAGFPLQVAGQANSDIKISTGPIEQVRRLADGYGLGYNANTQPGMSGGPVLNQEGQLIAIHGRADGERIGDVRVKQGSNWAVPINTAIAAFSLKSSSAIVTTVRPEPAPQKDTKNAFKTFSFQVVTLNNRGQIQRQQQTSAQYLQEDLGNGVTLDMVMIPGGSFTIGASSSEADSFDDERPQREMRIPSFAMGRNAITQAQWQAIMGNTPSRFKGNNRPVEGVNWNEAVAFCDKLSVRTGRVYRLPSEAEWEYACRAGTTSPFNFGETITPELVNYNGDYPYAEAVEGENRGETIEVGSFPPNAYGLYDMHGNVLEWCIDHWHENYNGAPTDGSAWTTGGDSERRILRGGSWYNNAGSCRSARRSTAPAEYRGNTIGFRVILSVASGA